MHEEDFSAAKSLLLDHSYQRWMHLDSIDDHYKRLIEDFNNQWKSAPFETGNKRRPLPKIYAASYEEWNAGCTIISDQANNKFEYALYAPKALIICSIGGGMGVSPRFEFFEIKDDQLIEVAQIGTFSSTLFDLVLMLRFDKRLTNWTKESEYTPLPPVKITNIKNK